MRFTALPATSLEDVTLDFEQLSGKTILDHAPTDFLQLATTGQALHDGTATITAPTWTSGTWAALTFAHGLGAQPKWADWNIIPGGSIETGVYLAQGYVDATNIVKYAYNPTAFNLTGGTIQIGWTAIL